MGPCAGPNRGTWSRFMRIKQQFLTHEGRALFHSLILAAARLP
jgi:hypothetical protein